MKHSVCLNSVLQEKHLPTNPTMKKQMKDSKIQYSIPICSKHSTPTQNKFASDDLIELSLQSTMNIEDNTSILNSKTHE